MLELTPAATGAARPRGHGPGVRGSAAQADHPAARREPAGARDRGRRVPAGRPDHGRCGPGERHARVLDRVGDGRHRERGAKRDARSRRTSSRRRRRRSAAATCSTRPARRRRCAYPRRPWLRRRRAPGDLAGARCRRRPRSSCRSSSAAASCGRRRRRRPERRGRPAGVLVLLYPDDDGLRPRRPDRAGEPRRPPQRRGQLPGRQGRARRRRHRGDRAARGGRGDRASTPMPQASGSSACSTASGSRSATSRSPRSSPSRTHRPAIDRRRPPRSPGSSSRRWSRFLPDAPIVIVERTIGDWPLRYGAYDVDGLSVWGATARILSQLGAVLADADRGDAGAAAPMAAAVCRIRRRMTRSLLRDAQEALRGRLARACPSRDPIADNSGNLIFLEAAYKLLDTRDAVIEPGSARGADDSMPDQINERFDVYVIPLANAFRPSFEEQPPATDEASIEKLTIPVIVLGVGLQAPPPDESGASRRAGTTRSRRSSGAVLDRSPSIGVRGEYTQDYLNQLGFRDVEVIGCPSMFLHGDQHGGITKRTPTLERDARIAMNITARVSRIGADRRRRTSSATRTSSTSPRTRIALRLLLWGEDHEATTRTSPMPIHRSHPLLRDDKAPLLRRSVAVARPHATVRLHVRDPDPRQHRGGPRRDAELRPRARRPDAGAGPLLRHPASGRR